MPPRRKIKLTIAYDGTDYHGWQIQPGLRTIQGTLCEAATPCCDIRRTYRAPVGRTPASTPAARWRCLRPRTPSLPTTLPWR